MKSVRNKANEIVLEYTKGFIEPIALQEMYSRLEEIGVTVGLIIGDACKSPKTTEWKYNGNTVNDSLFVYSIYRPEHTHKTEYSMYFS